MSKADEPTMPLAEGLKVQKETWFMIVYVCLNCCILVLFVEGAEGDLSERQTS